MKKTLLTFAMMGALIGATTANAECWQETTQHVQPPNILERNLGLLIGGTAGAFIGGEFGHGDGRKLATVGGGILGAFAGREVQNRYYPARANVSNSYTTRCRQ